MTTDTASTLRQLLDANGRFALDARGTTNHCPMALCALARMGAGPARLRAFFEHWERRYAIVAAPGVLDLAHTGDWRDLRGQGAAFAVCRALFVSRIGEFGSRAVLTDVLAQAPFAPASGAFHALIRLAYGLEEEHAGEIAAGLAALVCAPLPIDVGPAGRAAAASTREGFAALAEGMAGARYSGGAITARLRAVVRDARFAALLLAPPDSDRGAASSAALLLAPPGSDVGAASSTAFVLASPGSDVGPDGGAARLRQPGRDAGTDGGSAGILSLPSRARDAHATARVAGLLDELARAAIAAYALTQDFTALHIVTGLHAARIVLARLPPAHAERLLPDLWNAVCAAYVLIGAPALDAAAFARPEPSRPVGETWPALLALAVASDDDHVIKMSYTCWREDLREPNGLYLACAARLLGMAPS